ncbi:tryptophan transporter [Intestinibacter sp.]
MRTNTNTKRLTLNAILLAMGLVLHQVTPPIFTIKPDTTLIMLFTLMVINRDSYKTCLVAGIVAGIFAGMTSSFPGGQIPNLIDKFLTTNITFLIMIVSYKLPFVKNLGDKAKDLVVTGIMMVIGTFVSGTIFLTSAQIIVGLPGSFTMLFMSVVVPAVVINLIVGVLIYKIINVTVQKAILNV